jgi:hypothetical protein
MMLTVLLQQDSECNSHILDNPSNPQPYMTPLITGEKHVTRSQKISFFNKQCNWRVPAFIPSTHSHAQKPYLTTMGCTPEEELNYTLMQEKLNTCSPLGKEQPSTYLPQNTCLSPNVLVQKISSPLNLRLVGRKDS